MRFSHRPKIGDFIVAAACILLTVLLPVFMFGGGGDASKAVVYVDGETAAELSVSRTGSYETVLEGRYGPVTITVEGGRARISQSFCPDQVCVHTGWLSRPGQAAVCVPGHIMLVIEGERKDIDAIAD